ncbi:gastrula zinc finger protein XlCGF46.1-like [Macrosteles quadrilineatus]|uniref:gastrula zinc finger protein XlCGF46.1-like n=1 Tax=Macrosteles quadrilineatus TaxID=74068 RepID=UPI0023E20CD5|nr:gastrula zinc finger protein XlCGF46.1-like [Macrosteles quadrilineatus]
MNESFPLTSYKIPVRTKLEQILSMDFQHYLEKRNTFMCRRCLNLVETIEVLEVKLSTAKQTLNDNFSKTIQQSVPIIDDILHNEVSSQDVDKLLKNNNIPNKRPEEKPKNSEIYREQEPFSVENECPNEDKDPSISDLEQSEFQCSYCFKVLSSQKYLNYHLQQHTKEFYYYCERCGKGFPLKSNLQRHLNWHNSNEREADILCDICGDMFVSNDLFKSHLLKTHSQEYIYNCKICKKGFTRKLSLEIHIHKHTGARMFICEYCGHTFLTESNLRNHVKLCNKDHQHTCEECGKSFISESQLSKHESQHTGIYSYSCSVCNKGFHKPSDLNFHMLSHSTDKNFKCKECSKSFKTQGNLNYHIKTVHNKETIFKCEICAKNFFQKRFLSDHMKTHTNEEPYKCDRCEKTFLHQTTFITHLKVHEGKVKLKTCEVCGKSIKTRMSVHMRTHTGEKPYKCSYCPMAFSVGISLKKHIAVKHVKNKVS